MALIYIIVTVLFELLIMLRILRMRAYVKGEQTKLKFLSKKEAEEGKLCSNPLISVH